MEKIYKYKLDDDTLLSIYTDSMKSTAMGYSLGIQENDSEIEWDTPYIGRDGAIVVAWNEQLIRLQPDKLIPVKKQKNKAVPDRTKLLSIEVQIEAYDAIAEGKTNTYLCRRNCKLKPGKQVVLKRYNDSGIYTNKSIVKRIKYIRLGGSHGLDGYYMLVEFFSDREG